MMTDLWTGRRVVWLNTPRGGYGYTIKVPATVVERDGESVTIDAQLKDGSTRRVTVRAKNIISGCRSCRNGEQHRDCGQCVNEATQ